MVLYFDMLIGTDREVVKNVRPCCHGSAENACLGKDKTVAALTMIGCIILLRAAHQTKYIIKLSFIHFVSCRLQMSANCL